ncbi:MAG TPA: phosphate ABC transporter permease subunit PstC [Acidimicrobiales bacterium]|nr:phosphate ABC transporter permease subunit PstC [Acidimicrobiales bacterium]
MTTSAVARPPGPSAGEPARARRVVHAERSRADRFFDRATLGSGITVLVLLTVVGLFLLWQGRATWSSMGARFLTTTTWRPSSTSPEVGVLGLLYGTVVVALIAEVIAVPAGIGVGLYIAEFAPLGARKMLQGLVDLLAAVPSILFGLWGFFFLQEQIVPLSRWLTTHLGRIPLFATDRDAQLTSSFFIAGIVVSLMVVPIVASISRAVFVQTPPGEKEGALALGASRWGMVRAVMLPYGRGGMIGGSMLGLGRALGETIAVSLLLPQVPWISSHWLQNGGGTIAGFIADRAGNSLTVPSLMAAGLVLFVLTLATNLVASTIVARSRSGAGVDL